MKSLVAYLLFLSLLVTSACGSSAEQSENQTTEADEIVTTAISPATEQTEEQEMPATQPAEQSGEPEKQAAETTTDKNKPQAVRTSQKKVINQDPKVTVDDPETNSEDKTPSVEATSEAVEAPAETESVEEAPTPEIVNVEKATEREEAPKVPAVPDHSLWDALLQKYVTAAGKVNYAGFKGDKAQLQAYLDELAANPIQESWSRSEKMAYWINVYNAFTIKLIVDNYPVSSITKLHGGKPWDVKWIKLGNKTYSLDEVENDILRPKYKDARIHFAVNCAAKSCPPLLNRAWTGDNLNSYLEKQTKAFINNSSYNTISAKKAEVSKIFEWYAADFGDLVEYLNKYSETRINKGATVTYKAYDWALNN